MEESEVSLELKFMSFFPVETFSSLSEFSSHPMFSCIVTLCTLILLYLPRLFWKLVFSPVLILTGILLITILRIGANQRSQNEESEIPEAPESGLTRENSAEKEQEENQNSITEETDSLGKVEQWITTQPEPVFTRENRAEKEEEENRNSIAEETDSLGKVVQRITTQTGTEFKSEKGFRSNSLFDECFVESWNVKAPLEVIYEEYEGEEAEVVPNEKEDTRELVDDPNLSYPSLSRYYPESDSDSDSDSSSEGGFPAMEKWDSRENICLRWDEEDREGLIEIALDAGKNRAMDFNFEEDNLIEIDISPTRQRDFSGANELFSGEIRIN